VDAHIRASATSSFDALKNSELSKDRDWNLLRVKWEECVSELLLIVLRRLRELKSDYYAGATSACDDFSRSIIFSLDHTGLTSTVSLLRLCLPELAVFAFLCSAHRTSLSSPRVLDRVCLG
jgi:hypothetical protein